jgi:iron(III) transport system ATP-binding protein
MTSLSLSGIVKSFGSAPVIAGVSLEVHSGEFFSLLGPSGCGKSTLLRIIAGLESADAGSVSIGENPVDSVPPQKRGIGMVFQQYALWPHMTIAQNVRFGLETQGLTNKERDARMNKALERVQMVEYRDRYPHQISGGQQQRVALARALAMEPSIILLDEPLSNLDARLRAEIRHELAELHQRLGTTMVYVTHDQEDALSLSSRLAIMNRGTIEQVATPQDVYRDPATPLCARFIGDANLRPCSVLARDTETSAHVALIAAPNVRFNARVRAGLARDVSTGFLCLRPSALSVEPLADKRTQSHNHLTAQVVRSSYKGSEYDVEVLTDQKIVLRGSYKPAGLTQSEPSAVLQPGTQVVVSWPVGAGCFVPADNP